MVTNNVLDLIGNTHLINLYQSTGYNIYAKVEFLNPGGSIKDRVAYYMLTDAEKSGKLKSGMTIVEPTSGNTGIGLALAGVRKGYRVIIVMPENMSEERKKLIQTLGAELILTPANLSIGGSVAKVEELTADSDQYFVPQQFKNPANPYIHFSTTAVELYEQLAGKIDVFVSGLGSGGTLQGIGSYLKEINPNIKVVAVEPKNVSALLGDEPGLHSIQGIGDGFIPDVLDTKIIDEVIEVTDEDAFEATRKLSRVQGLLCGTSSGANVWASIQIAKRYGEKLTITTVLPDRMERYFSTGLFQ